MTIVDPALQAAHRHRSRALIGRNPELLVKLAREQTQEALRTLINIMADLEQPGAVRVRAAELLLERGWGKTPQQIVLHDADGAIGMAAIPLMERIAAIKAARSGGETIELEASELTEAKPVSTELTKTEKVEASDKVGANLI